MAAPFFDFFLKWLLERREHHCLRRDNMLVKDLDGIFEACDVASGRAFELRQSEVLAGPFEFHLFQTFLDVMLLEGLFSDIFARLGVLNHT